MTEFSQILAHRDERVRARTYREIDTIEDPLPILAAGLRREADRIEAESIYRHGDNT